MNDILNINIKSVIVKPNIFLKIFLKIFLNQFKLNGKNINIFNIFNKSERFNYRMFSLYSSSP